MNVIPRVFQWWPNSIKLDYRTVIGLLFSPSDVFALCSFGMSRRWDGRVSLVVPSETVVLWVTPVCSSCLVVLQPRLRPLVLFCKGALPLKSLTVSQFRVFCWCATQSRLLFAVIEYQVSPFSPPLPVEVTSGHFCQVLDRYACKFVNDVYWLSPFLLEFVTLGYIWGVVDSLICWCAWGRIHNLDDIFVEFVIQISVGYGQPFDDCTVVNFEVANVANGCGIHLRRTSSDAR